MVLCIDVHMCTCAEIRAICCARPFSVHGNCWTSAACNWMLHTKDLAIPFVRVFCLIFFCSIGNLKKKHLNAVICKVQKCNSHLIFSGAAWLLDCFLKCKPFLVCVVISLSFICFLNVPLGLCCLVVFVNFCSAIILGNAYQTLGYPSFLLENMVHSAERSHLTGR